MLGPELLLTFPSLLAQHQWSTDPDTILTYSEQSAWLYTLLGYCLELEFVLLLLCRHMEKEATQLLCVKMAEQPLISSIHFYQTPILNAFVMVKVCLSIHITVPHLSPHPRHISTLIFYFFLNQR